MRRFAAVAAALLTMTAAFAHAQEGAAATEGLVMRLVTAELPRGATIGALLNTRTGTTADTIVLLFPGSPGIMRFEPAAGAVVRTLQGNTLVRARRHLTQQGVATAIVDCPSDQWDRGCKADYRHSPQHADDVAALLAALTRETGIVRFFAAGHSLGTVSSSYLARHLPGLSGAIHLSTIGGSSAFAHEYDMSGFDWRVAKIPQLFVHHKFDLCRATPFFAIKGSIGDLPIVTVTGLTDNPRGEPCQAQAQHGLAGREREVMQAIRQWIDAGTAPAEIE
jgi:hypothetical protein